jgi:branched-chain amino acid transport system ATP-binding protein
MNLLEMEEIDVFIGAVQVLRKISLNIGEAEIISLVGRNGAGKTSIIRTIMGLLKPEAGRIRFKGKDISGLPSYKIAKMGIGLAPDYRGIFTDLTVSENIDLPRWVMGQNILKDREDRKFDDEIFDIYPELEPLRNREGLALSGGEGKMLAVARALALRPYLLLLDEPLEGLAPIVVERFVESIKKIQSKGVSILTAESNISHATKLSKMLYIVERGEIVFHGEADELYKKKELDKLVRGY